MVYYISVDLDDKRIYDTAIQISESEYIDILKEKTVPLKFFISAKEAIELKYNIIDFQKVSFGIRKDGEKIEYLTIPQ